MWRGLNNAPRRQSRVTTHQFDLARREVTKVHFAAGGACDGLPYHSSESLAYREGLSLNVAA